MFETIEHAEDKSTEENLNMLHRERDRALSAKDENFIFSFIPIIVHLPALKDSVVG